MVLYQTATVTLKKMGKRKTRKPPPKKVQPKLPSSFDCPFCNHEGTVECTIDKKKSTGKVCCRVCGAFYQTNITYITEAIDLYSEWIDECEKANAEESVETERQEHYQQIQQQRVTHQPANHESEEEEEEDQYSHPMYHRGTGY